MNKLIAFAAFEPLFELMHFVPYKAVHCDKDKKQRSDTVGQDACYIVVTHIIFVFRFATSQLAANPTKRRWGLI
jgi:hypothetical protein